MSHCCVQCVITMTFICQLLFLLTERVNQNLSCCRGCTTETLQCNQTARRSINWLCQIPLAIDWHKRSIDCLKCKALKAVADTLLPLCSDAPLSERHGSIVLRGGHLLGSWHLQLSLSLLIGYCSSHCPSHLLISAGRLSIPWHWFLSVIASHPYTVIPRFPARAEDIPPPFKPYIT